MDSKEIRAIILDWVKLVTRMERYYFPKAIDLFLSLPTNHQRGLLSFFADKISEPRWSDVLDDSTRYVDVIRSILFYYSGRKRAGQPTKENFAICLGEYIKSKFFEEAEGFKKASRFSKALEAI